MKTWPVVVIFVVGVLIAVYGSDKPKVEPVVTPTPAATTVPDTETIRRYSAPSSESRTTQTFDGYRCTVDCGGHRAGYRWAEQHDIDNEDACEAAADHSNSPSFGEGCKAFVNGATDDQ